MSRTEKMTVEELKRNISREIDCLPEHGVTTEDGGWNSKKDEEERLRRLHHEICYFMREYT